MLDDPARARPPRLRPDRLTVPDEAERGRPVRRPRRPPGRSVSREAQGRVGGSAAMDVQRQPEVERPCRGELADERVQTGSPRSGGRRELGSPGRQRLPSWRIRRTTSSLIRRRRARIAPSSSRLGGAAARIDDRVEGSSEVNETDEIRRQGTARPQLRTRGRRSGRSGCRRRRRFRRLDRGPVRAAASPRLRRAARSRR